MGHNTVKKVFHLCSLKSIFYLEKFTTTGTVVATKVLVFLNDEELSVSLETKCLFVDDFFLVDET